MLIYHLFMFLQLHKILFVSLVVAIDLTLIFAAYLTDVIWDSELSARSKTFFVTAFRGVLVFMFIFMCSLMFSISLMPKFVDSISMWRTPIKIDKIVTDEANGSTDSNIHRVRYLVTDKHVYTVSHPKSIATDVVPTTKPTYFTYSRRVLKPTATKLEREYFEAVKSRKLFSYDNYNKIKFGKLVKHAHLR